MKIILRAISARVKIPISRSQYILERTSIELTARVILGQDISLADMFFKKAIPQYIGD
jgi:hypothetical protein